MRLLRAAIWLVCVAQVACATYTLPPAKVPAQPRAADWPDAGVAILEDMATLEYRILPADKEHPAHLVAVLDHRRRMKVLRDSGLAKADVALPIDGYSTITRVVARSVSPDGRQSSIGRRDQHVEPREPPDEQAADIKELQFHVPDAQVGGLIEYRYERVFTDPTLVEPWVFANEMPVLRSELHLLVDPAVQIDYVYGHGEKLVDRPPERRTLPDGREVLVFAELDMPGFFREPSMPHTSRLAPWMAVVLRRVQIGDKVSRYDSWDAVADAVWERMRQVNIAPGEGSLKERYELVRTVLRPLALPGLGVHPPASGPALAKGAPACSRDATSVLLQAFAGSQAEAYPALLVGASGPPMADNKPGNYPFVRMVVALRVGRLMLQNQICTGPYLKRGLLCTVSPDDFFFLDPLCKHCAFGVLPNDLMGGRALLLKNDGTQWVDMPLDAPERHAATVRMQWDMDERGTLAGTLTGELRGTQAQALRARLSQVRAEGEETAERTAAIRDALAGNEPTHLELSSGKLIDQEKIELSVGVYARLASQAERRDARGFRLRAIDLFGSSIPAEWRPLRRLPAVLHGPIWMEMNADFNLPNVFRVITKPPVQIASPFAEYAAGFSLKEGKLRYARRFVLKAHTISAAQWPEFAEFITQVRDAEADGPIVYDPGA